MTNKRVRGIHWTEQQIHLDGKPRELTKEETKKLIEKEKEAYFRNCGYTA